MAAFAQVWHAQFLARTAILREFFPQESDWASKSNDRAFDVYLNSREILRLGVTEPLVAHLGNSIAPRYRDELAALLDDDKLRAQLSKGRGGWRRLIMRLPGLRRLVLRLHALTFRLIYNVD